MNESVLKDCQKNKMNESLSKDFVEKLLKREDEKIVGILSFFS